MRIKLGKTARELRAALGISQRRAADMLGITSVHLCNVEKGRAAPSQHLIDKYRELWGIDLYVLAWCRHGHTNELPVGVWAAARALEEAWQQELRGLGKRTVG